MSKFRKYRSLQVFIKSIVEGFFFSSMHIAHRTKDIHILRNHKQGGQKCLLSVLTIFVVIQGGGVKNSQKYAQICNICMAQQSNRTGNIFCLKSGNIHFYALSYFFLDVIKKAAYMQLSASFGSISLPNKRSYTLLFSSQVC